MTQNLLIGVRGWEHAAWQGRFYPEELPPEWRFCYYSNRIRSVLVPGSVWASVAPAEVAAWAQDSDAEFRFVLEAPPSWLEATPTEAVLASFFDLTAPLLPLTAGLLVRMPENHTDTGAWLDRWLPRITEYQPVCVDLPAALHNSRAVEALTRHGGSLCWHPGRTSAPRAEGQFLVALAVPSDARALGDWIAALARWQGDTRQAALFFEGGADTAQSALDARVLAELFGV